MANSSAYHISDETQSLAAGFEYWKNQHPDATALHISGKEYSYAELFAMAMPIAAEIQNAGVSLVGIYCNNDVYSYAAILAATYCGVCYVPLNAKFPEARLQTIIDQCELQLVVCGEPVYKAERLENVSRVYASLLQAENVVSIKEHQQELAYILFTSGSTGKPKGVPVSKKNVNAFFRYYLSQYDFRPFDRFLQPYELSFDVSVFSIFCAWNAGATVVVVKDSNAKYLEIFKTIGEQKITVASMVPGVLRLIAPYLKEFSFPLLRYSFFSGDALYHTDALAWSKCLPNGVIHNFYGPTETTIVCTRYIWQKETGEQESHNGIVPLGKAFPQMQWLLLNENMQIIHKTDIAGELCFSGAQVIRNYLNDQSEESFFSYEDKYWYRTGDLASVNENGNLVFHGRIDKQVKINGYRVELQEIEKHITDLTKKESLCITEKTDEISKLAAVIEGSHYTEQEIRAHLSSLLPEYMIPSRFIFVDAFPKTINGKTDMQTLKKLIHE